MILVINMDETETKIHTCARCHYETNDKYAMIKHLQRKSPCKTNYSEISCEELLKQYEREYADNAVECDFCHKKFNHKNNLYVHKKKCKQRPDIHNETDGPTTSISNSNSIPVPTTVPTSQNNTSILSDSSEMKLMVNFLEQILHEMKNNGMNRPVINNIENQTIQNIQNQNVQNVQINLNKYGDESKSHITNDMLTKCLENHDVLQYVKALHFNPEVPENHNVKRITSSKDYYKNQFLVTFDDQGTWQHQQKEDVLKGVISKGFKAMMDHMISLKNDSTISDEKAFALNQWINESFLNPKQFMKKIFALTLNDEFFLLKD